MLKYFGIAMIFAGLSSPALSKEYWVDKEEYFPSLQVTCRIQVSKGSVTDIAVVCGDGRGGNCSGHKLDDYFSCFTHRGNSTSIKTATAAINWILNNMS